MQNNNEHIDFDLLAKYLSGETTEAERAEVQRWLEANPKNQGVLEELREVLGLAERSKTSVAVDTDGAWSKMQERMHAVENGKVVSMVPQWGRIAVAAAFIAFVAITAVLLNSILSNSPTVSMAVVTTDTSTLADTLPDGSIVTLNNNSSIEYPETFSDRERRVALKGEAFFEVMRNREQPFVIEAGAAEVRVLGTSFNVRAYEADENIEVIVESGKVQLSDMHEAEIVLEAGEKGVFNKGTALLVELPNDEVDYQFWRLRKLVFANTALNEVVEVLNDQYEANLTIEDEVSRTCRFTATFEDDSLETILKVLTATFNLKLEMEANKRILKGRACEGDEL